MLAWTEKVIMQTAIANVVNHVRHEVCFARVMLDSGSQRSYMTTKLKNDLKLKVLSSEQFSVRSFASKRPKKIKASLIEVDLHCHEEDNLQLKISVIPQICG